MCLDDLVMSEYSECKTFLKSTDDFIQRAAGIRLVATDLDGTLLVNPDEVPEDFMEWVSRHPDICIVIASGRQYYNLRKLFDKHKDRLVFVAENGGIVFEGDRALYINEMSKKDVWECMDRIGEKGTQSVILCGEKSAYMRHASPEAEKNAAYYYERLTFVEDLAACIQTDKIVKIAVYFEEHDAERNYDRLCGINERVQASLSGECWIDLSNNNADKGNALTVIQKYYHISREECMAFGDYLNDYGLLINSAESYAMENAHPDLKKIAKHIAPSNQERGVQKVLTSVFG